jgi:hypothetical protein
MVFKLFGEIVWERSVRCGLRSCWWWLLVACVVVCAGALCAVVWVGVWRECWVVVCVGVAMVRPMRVACFSTACFGVVLMMCGLRSRPHNGPNSKHVPALRNVVMTQEEKWKLARQLKKRGGGRGRGKN